MDEFTPGRIMDDNTTAAIELERVLFEIKKVIVGQDHMVERLLVALLARGHILLEGLPGLAKTLAVSTMAKAIGGSFVRLQFTPDLLPSDLVGTRIWRASEERFDIEWGPVFANLVLTDEINRAPAKVQSALLEVMAERQVSIGGRTRPLPQPFLVLATQNPIESEGVYTLPEAQRDRFLMKVLVGYPSPTEELEIVRRVGVSTPEAGPAMSLEELQQYQAAADRVFVDAAVAQYAVDLVMATREPGLRGMPELEPLIDFGVSPRATLGLVAASRALAVLRGRSYVVPQDVFDVSRDVLRHRLMLSYEALAKGLSADDVLNRILAVVPAAPVTPVEPDRSTPASRSGGDTAQMAVPPAPTPDPPATAPTSAAPSGTTPSASPAASTPPASTPSASPTTPSASPNPAPANPAPASPSPTSIPPAPGSATDDPSTAATAEFPSPGTTDGDESTR
ncbi:MAG: AAA family ATPase [Actinomycetota bacterium]